MKTTITTILLALIMLTACDPKGITPEQTENIKSFVEEQIGDSIEYTLFITGKEFRVYRKEIPTSTIMEGYCKGDKILIQYNFLKSN